MQVSSWESQEDLGSSQESSLPLPLDSSSVRLGQFIEHLQVAGIVLGVVDTHSAHKVWMATQLLCLHEPLNQTPIGQISQGKKNISLFSQDE